MRKNYNKPCVYVLVDPFTNDVRYVGSTTTRMSAKLAVHIFDAKTFQHYTSKWIRSLQEKGAKPIIEVLEYCKAEERLQLEQFYIRYLHSLGIPLTNTAYIRKVEGRPKTLTKEHREKLSKAKQGKTVHNNRKKIHQFTLDGVFIKEWRGVIHAQKEMKCKAISVTIKKHGRAAGFLWKYVD